MRSSIYAFLLLLSISYTAASQQLVSTTLLGSKTKTALTAQFGLPMSFGARYYRITYTTSDLQGLTDTVSGLIAVPDDPIRIYPRLVYQHGTAGSPLGVPSFNVQQGGEGNIGLLFAGLGYVALLPDYLGLGVSDGFHPYVHAASEAWVAADMLRALPEFCSQELVNVHEQLFVTGYSQGGHAAMALHREIETNLSGEFTVTAAAHLSGPYSIGEVMRSLILSDDIYYYPAYLPNTILSYQTVYGGLFDQIGDVFRQPYATAIADFYTGALTLDQLNSQLIASLTSIEGASRPLRMLQPDIVQEVTNDPNHPFNVALRDNDVYDWAPEAPTRIFYCMADDQVPYQNSLLARDTMLARGAANLVATDVDPTADHGGCVVPALTYTVFFFAGYQEIGALLAASDPDVQPLSLRPNPAASAIYFDQLSPGGSLRITDISGRVRMALEVTGTQAHLDVSALENGLYIVQYQHDGVFRQAKLAVQH
ncbi:MAG: T9SS type A sorting domain-containing protein [Saprospiraceae bacterium]|nr:T9SS type A sorting domain-containing protein [Saprospiraceae bacterium]